MPRLDRCDTSTVKWSAQLRLRPRKVPSASADHLVEPVHETLHDGRELDQLFEVSSGELIEQPLSFRGEHEVHDPPVVLIHPPPHEPSLFGSIDELDRAVVAQEEMVGDVADGGRRLVFVAADGEEQLVLLPGETGGAGLLVAPVQEAAQRRAEAEELAVLIVAQQLAGHAK